MSRHRAHLTFPETLMAVRRRTQRALSILLPMGVLGASTVLATAHAKPSPAGEDASRLPEAATPGVAERLAMIRESASRAESGAEIDLLDGPEKILLAQWINIGGGGGTGFGWRNAPWANGWGNGGWRNAPWANGWRNAPWGNGWRNAPWANGWHNWGNGWHNWGNGGWRNYWNNW
jgi:hypothetical protein